MDTKMEAERHCVILNPHAGRGLAGRRRADLERALHAAGVPFDLWTTDAPGSIVALTRQALAQGYRRLVVVGGDGSISEAAGALLRSQEEGGGSAVLGIVPFGTGNDFIKSLEGVAVNDIVGAAARLAAGHTRHIDAGRVRVSGDGWERTGYFLNNLALGIDAHVAAESNRITWLRGQAVYLVAAVRALLRYRASEMTLRFDGHERRQPFLLATIANGRCQGGGFWLTPDAALDDGQFDMCLVEPLRADQVIHYVLRAMRGNHTGLSRVEMARASQIEVIYSAPALVVTDGEVIATEAQHLRVELLPHALKLLL